MTVVPGFVVVGCCDEVCWVEGEVVVCTIVEV